MRKRAGALYIKNRKLFLICEGQQDFFWTPGGGLEKHETFKQALERELKEELNADLVASKLYITMHDKEADGKVCYYLVDLILPTSLPGNTVYRWYTREAYNANTVKISQRIYNHVYPKLIADSLV